jgi:uncharacterized protein YoxC
MNNELLTIFVGIIAVCMLLITVAIVLIGIQAVKTMKRIHEFIDSIQNELSFLSTKAALTLHEMNEMMSNLKTETHSLGTRSLLTLDKLYAILGYIHVEIQSLALKASSGITKVTFGSLAIDAIFKFFNKDKRMNDGQK